MTRRFHYGPTLAVRVVAGIGFAMWHYRPQPATPAAPAATPAIEAPTTAAPTVATPPPEQFPIDQVLVPALDGTDDHRHLERDGAVAIGPLPDAHPEPLEDVGRIAQSRVRRIFRLGRDRDPVAQEK